MKVLVPLVFALSLVVNWCVAFKPSPSLPEDIPIGGAYHRCIHDTVSKTALVGEIPSLLTHSKLLKRQVATPLRVVVNTDALESDPDRLCTTVNQWVKFNNPSGSASVHSPECGSDPSSGENCWFQCTTADILTTEKKQFLFNKVIPDISSYLHNALGVDGVVGNLVFPSNRDQCGCQEAVTIPDSYKTEGVPDADLVIFLTARTTRLRGNTIAFACGCLRETGSGRPVAGHVNWGPNAIDLDDIDYPKQLGVGIHEVTHVLAFSEGLYPYYPTPPSGSVTRTIQQTSGGMTHSVTIIQTEKVIEIAREHFGCDTLEGLELENGAGSGTAGSHWERRLVMNEYMTGYSSYDPIKSKLTLALLEDSGWYSPNYTAAEDLTFGKGQGCSFASDRCSTRAAPYNCDPQLRNKDEDCMWDGLKKGKCNIETYNGALDAWYQYYGSANVGGGDDLADYCGFYRYQTSYRGDCTIPEYNQAGSSQFSFVSFGEVFSPSSRCIRAYNSTGDKGPSCHNMTCVGNLLKIKVGLIWYDCTAGGRVEVSTGFEDGYFECPSNPTVLCQTLPHYTAWPTFVDVTPTSGIVGDRVVVRGSGFQSTDGLKVYFGLDHGCSESSMNFTVESDQTLSIECIIGQRREAKTLRGNNKVDVVISDGSGRTATGFKGFSLSNALPNVAPQKFIIVCLVMILLLLRS